MFHYLRHIPCPLFQFHHETLTFSVQKQMCATPEITIDIYYRTETVTQIIPKTQFTPSIIFLKDPIGPYMYRGISY